jgi:thiol-disulfide isomerase/thioredoxin
MNPSPDVRRRHAMRRLAVIMLGGLAGVAVGLAGVYGIARLAGNAPVATECKVAAQIAQRIAPLARGEVAAVAVAKSPKRLPDLAFRDAAGGVKTLTDWRGRTLVLNLWATWCVPCREEMPALDALQAKLGSPTFEVVAINIDTRDPQKPKTWLKEAGIERLTYYADNTAKVFQDLKEIGKAFGMPTTLIIDPAGCEIATLAGPAQWASDDAIKLVQAAIQG